MSISRETLISLLFKMAAIGVTFVGVSVLVRNLGATAYGAWATLASTLMWIQLSDFGIGIVIRNRVANRRVDLPVADSVAAALTLTAVISLVLVAVYAVVWRHVSVARDYPLASALMYVSALLMLPASVGVNILQGLGLARVTFQASLVQLSLWLVFVIVLGMHPSIIWLAVGFAILWIGICLYQLHRALYELGLFTFGFVRRLVSAGALRELSAMLPIGCAFFLLQLTSLVLFNLGTYLSYTLFSADAAAKYDILNKIYQIPVTLFNVIITVAWSRITQEAGLGNYVGLERIQRGLLSVAAAGCVAVLCVSMLAVRPFIDFYSHGQISVSLTEVIAFSAQIAVQMFAYAAAVFMNAVQRLRMQLIFALASSALFVPVFQALRLAGFGVTAVPLSTALVLLPSAVWFNVYVHSRIIRPLRLTRVPVDGPAAAT